MMIIALAGRRIDPIDAPFVRFPLANRDLVQQRLYDFFLDMKATNLVASGACGADLVGHLAATAAGMTSTLVLPFNTRRFRRTSVTDRPGNWGPIYDRIYRSAHLAKQVITVDSSSNDQDAYQRATQRIIERAQQIASLRDDQVLAVAVWEGRSRGPDDMTQVFIEMARDAGMQCQEVRSDA